MIDNFTAFSFPHLFGMIIPVLAGAAFIITGIKLKEVKSRKLLNFIFIILLILTRSSRYIMDLFTGRFDIFDILSLQICHIDLILLVICLFKPNKVLFHFVFLVGIPMGLAVALFPGRVHPAPGLPRAVLFIMSHMLLVVGAIYLAAVEKMVLRLKYTLSLLGLGNLFLIIIYFINKALGTNFLYIMFAPEGTLIKKLESIFGWPGYVAAMDVIAITVIMLTFVIYKVIAKINPAQSLKEETVS